MIDQGGGDGGKEGEFSLRKNRALILKKNSGRGATEMRERGVVFIFHSGRISENGNSD